MSIAKSAGGSDIRNATINIADEKELEFIQGLQSLGINRSVASLITYLQDMNERSSRDIEMATGLRQPEVSMAMRTLREKGWVTEHEVKGDGKGRPQKIYALRSTVDEIIKYYEMEKSQEVSSNYGGHPEAEGAKLCVISEGDISFTDSCAQIYRLFD